MTEPGEPPAPDEFEESDESRLRRNMGELLQELRVAQAGVQILFAFLLSVAFTARFAQANAFQRHLALVTVLLTTASAILLMTPAAWHRALFRLGQRTYIIRWANRFALAGLAFLAAAMTGAVLLVADTVIGGWPAMVIAGGTVLLFTLLWFVWPLCRRLRALRPAAGGKPGARPRR